MTSTISNPIEAKDLTFKPDKDITVCLENIIKPLTEKDIRLKPKTRNDGEGINGIKYVIIHAKQKIKKFRNKNGLRYLNLYIDSYPGHTEKEDKHFRIQAMISFNTKVNGKLINNNYKLRSDCEKGPNSFEEAKKIALILGNECIRMFNIMLNTCAIDFKYE